MLGIKRNTIIISAISLALLAILVTVIWLFFPIILRTISPTWYAQYAFVRTVNIVREEITEINDFFDFPDFPDFSDSDVMRLTIDSSDISANVSYGGFFSPSVNLSNLNIGIDLLHDRNTKQASLDLNTSWGDNSFLLTLYANITQVAFGIDDNVSWAVNADSIGKELAGLGLPVDEDLEIDLGFLFPDFGGEDRDVNIPMLMENFVRLLTFIRSGGVRYFTNDDGTVVTARVCGNALESLIYSFYGSSEADDEIRDSIANISASDHELTVFINKEHFVEAVHITVNVNTSSTVILTAQLLGTENMIDHILLDVRIENDYGYQLYSLESKGQYVPVDSKLTNTTTISGFDIGEVYISSEIREGRALSIAAQLGSTEFDIEGILYVGDDTIELNLHNVNLELNLLGTISMSGGFNVTLGTTSQEIRDITSDAYNIADFEAFEFYTLFQIVWDVVRQDRTLIEMIGTQLYDFVLTSLFGEQIASYIRDTFDDSVAEIIDKLNDLLADRVDNALDLLTGFLDGRTFDGLEGFLGENLIDNITGRLAGVRGFLNRFFSR